MSQEPCPEYSLHQYNYPPMIGLPPSYDSSADSVNPPEYLHGSLLDISGAADRLITGNAPYCYLNCCEQLYHLTNAARGHRSKLTRTPSIIQAVRTGYRPRHRQRIMELAWLPALLVHDIVAPPCHLAQMVAAVCRSGVERKRANAEILEEMTESLLLSLQVVWRMVTRLGLEEHEAVEQQMLNGGSFKFLTLARLLEAYGSRFAPSGTIYLASQKRLPKEHCSGTARLQFEQIHDLKEALKLIDLAPGQDLDASSVLESCLRRAYPSLEEAFMATDEAPEFCGILQKLHHIRRELPGLLASSSTCTEPPRGMRGTGGGN